MMKKDKIPGHVVYNKGVIDKLNKNRFHLPIYAFIQDRKIKYDSIIEAWKDTGIHYNLIFESCIGKIKSASGYKFEYINGIHYIKYKSMYVRSQRKLDHFRKIGFNG